MSEADQDRIVGSVARKIGRRFIVPVLVIFIAQIAISYISDRNDASEDYVGQHYKELYRLIAELQTTQVMYMKANDQEKILLWERINYLISRMDEFTLHDVTRDISNLPEPERKYGLEFTTLL